MNLSPLQATVLEGLVAGAAMRSARESSYIEFLRWWQLSGSSLFGIELWYLAKPENMSSRSATGYAVTDLVCAVICVIGVVSSTMNALGWMFILAYLASISRFIYSRRQLA